MWRVIVQIVVTVLVIGALLDFLRLFGVRLPELPLALVAVGAILALNWKALRRADRPLTPEEAANPHFEKLENAHAQTSAMRADTHVAEATMRRERARAALEEAEADLAEVRQRKGAVQ